MVRALRRRTACTGELGWYSEPSSSETSAICTVTGSPIGRHGKAALGKEDQQIPGGLVNLRIQGTATKLSLHLQSGSHVNVHKETRF